MISGLHAPDASHLLLLEAVAGSDLVQRAYDSALEYRYLWHERPFTIAEAVAHAFVKTSQEISRDPDGNAPKWMSVGFSVGYRPAVSCERLRFRAHPP